jgi:RsiW-degrading membrane proteinase PrsW (M82 family)
MTPAPPTNHVLKQISPKTQIPVQYLLISTAINVIGRDPSCQVVLDSTNYQGVSRQHIEIQQIPLQASGNSYVWQIRDLGSANGTAVNGKRLQGTRTLAPNDVIQLGRNGPEFAFECLTSTPRPLAQSLPIDDSSLRLSQVIPIISARKDLFSKAFLIPGILTIILVIGLFALLGIPILFNALLATYLAGAAFYFVYRLSGKQKPWWLMIGATIFTMLILGSPVLYLFIFVFRQLLPGDVEAIGIENNGLVSTFIKYFFGAGLMEELLKALPVFGAMWLGRRLKSPRRERLGVWEPLDGILLGAASAVGFTLLETLGQYVPGVVQDIAAQGYAGAGELYGLQLLIPRIVGSIAGHMAYSGYFGYFIGLSVLKPSKRWTLLSIGYLTASLLHALWNTTAHIPILGPILGLLVGIVSYGFLMSAILKARRLSPNRSKNFATLLHPPNIP